MCPPYNRRISVALTNAERQALWRERHRPSELLKHLKETQRQLAEAHKRIAELEAQLRLKRKGEALG